MTPINSRKCQTRKHNNYSHYKEHTNINSKTYVHSFSSFSFQINGIFLHLSSLDPLMGGDLAFGTWHLYNLFDKNWFFDFSDLFDKDGFFHLFDDFDLFLNKKRHLLRYLPIVDNGFNIFQPFLDNSVNVFLEGG